MTDNNHRSRVLVMTVGTGNLDDLEGTLIAPMLKSISDGEWRRVILLPSQFSDALAQMLRQRVTNSVVEIRELPNSGQENDADACFGHFDMVLSELITQGNNADKIVVDFTRGTKAMSAACVLAAMRHDIPTLRYVHSQRRDERGMVVPGTEMVGEIATSLVTVRKRLDLAADLIRRGDFGSVTAIVPDSTQAIVSHLPNIIQKEATGLRAVAEFCAAWDRFDYRSSFEACCHLLDTDVEILEGFQPDSSMRDWLETLASEPNRSDMKGYAMWLRAIVCDLLANAERRMRDRQFEDVLIRAYRVLELVGQIRLFCKGYDSENLDPGCQVVKKYRQYLQNKKRDFSVANGKLQAARRHTAGLLKRLNDPLAKKLLQFENQCGGLNPLRRNSSILIHGFSAQTTSKNSHTEDVFNNLKSLLKDLEALLIDDDASAPDRLGVARRLDFERSR